MAKSNKRWLEISIAARTADPHYTPLQAFEPALEGVTN